MRVLIILISSIIFTGLYAQQTTAIEENTGKEIAIWKTFKITEQTSARQLAENKSALKLGNDDNLILSDKHTDQLGYIHYRYQQTYKDIPIENAIYLMHEKAGRVKHANGKLAHQLQLNVVPSISTDAALVHALAQVNAQVYAWDAPAHERSLKRIRKSAEASFYPVGKLVIINPKFTQKASAYRLAYKFDIYAIEPLSRQIVYIDAHTGEVLTTLEKIHQCTGESVSGATHYSGEVNFTACQSDGTYTLESDIGGGIQVFNANHTYSNPQIPFTDTDDFFDGDPAAVEVQWATETAYNYFQNVHGRNSLDDNGMPLHSWVHYGYQLNNAFWNGSWMTYGDGDNERFSSPTSPDVVGHEMTHGITDFSADLIYSHESGALNESFSDIFGEVIEAACKPNGNDWIIGGDIVVKPGKNGLRSMSNPNSFTMLTQQPDTYQGNYWHDEDWDYGGVHTNSGVQNHWFYLLSEGGSGINDNGYAYNLAGIGMEKAAAIAYHNLTVYLTPNAQYADAREGAIRAAEDLYDENSDEVAQVIEAWCAVGVGQCGLLEDCREQDSLALVALYDATDGINWTNTWNLMQPMETWFGVTLNENGCVNFLAVSFNNLKNNIPPDLGNLANLEALSLDSNQLTGAIPPELGNLTNLRNVFLWANQLTGNIPSELGNLANLESIMLDDNQLTGSIPPEFGNLNNLSWLGLSNNQLIGSIPLELANLSNLTNMNLHNNQLSGCYSSNLVSLCSQLGTNSTNQNVSDGNNFDAPWEDFCATQAGSCPLPVCVEDDYIALRALYLSTDGDNWTNNAGWLTEAEFIANPTMPAGTDMGTWYKVTTNEDGCVTALRMVGNQLTGSISSELGSLNNLETLELRGNQLTGNMPPELGNLDSLSWFDISDNQLTGNIPTEFGNLSSMYWLDLSGNQLTGNILPEFGQLSEFFRLVLSNNQLTGNIPPELGNLSNLWSLGLSSNQLTGNIPPELGNLNATNIHLHTNQFIGNIPIELSNISNLRILSLHSNQLTGCYSANIVSLCSALGNYSTNEYISDGNNFDATWEDFCATQAGICPLPNCQEDDYIALRALYLSTDGDNWFSADSTDAWPNAAFFTANPTMPVGTDVDTWHGVTTDESGCVAFLSLPNNQLNGNIPPELEELNHLISFIAFDNQLSGSIPPELGNLSTLRSLSLYRNNLTGNIPTELGNINNLNILELFENQLIGNIPVELTDSGSLVAFSVSYNQLSGCYHSGLISFCSQISTNENQYISDGNNFDATWEDFCATQAGICSNFTDVYPGDFNNDNIANIQDLLYWGIADGYVGAIRPNATLNWEPQPSEDWTVSAANVNSKHQDGDGNGVVNNIDLEALIANYDSTHNFTTPGIESPIQFVFQPVDVLIENDLLTMTYNMFVESSLGSPVSLHGLAFSLDFGVLPVNSLSVNFDNSVLMPEEVMDVYNPLDNTLDIALTRTDKVNQTCDGSLLTAIVVTDDLDFMEPFTCQINGGQLMTTGGIDDTDGILTAISSSTLTSMVSPSGLFVALNTTPIQCNVGGTAEVSYINGTAPYTYAWSTGENMSSVSDLDIGTHQVTVTDAEGLQAVLEFDLEWAFTPVSAITDGGKICIDIANAPLAEAIEISIDNGTTYMSAINDNICYDVSEGEYQIWMQQASLQCPVYLDSLSVIIDNTTTIDNNPINIQLLNTLENQSQIAYTLDRSGDMRVSLYNTHGQLIRNIETAYVQAGEHRINVNKNDLPAGLYYIHVEFTAKNQPSIYTTLKLPVMR